MATKFSKKKFNKKKLAKSLDNIASKVAKRNGYFFVKNQFNFYDILEQHTKQKIIVDIPFQRTASAVTKRLNTKDDTQNISVDRVQAKVQQFHKHYNDTVFYNHTIQHLPPTTSSPLLLCMSFYYHLILHSYEGY